MIWEHKEIRLRPEEWLQGAGITHNAPGILKCALNFLREWANEEDFIIATTSGSTGTPATIRLSKKMMRASAQRTINFFGLSEGMRGLLCLSPDFIAGKMMIVRALECRMDLVLREPGDTLLSRCDNEFDFAAMVPLQVRSLLGDSPEMLRRVKRMLIGGAELDAGSSEKLREYISESYESYGMTETASHVALRKCGDTNRLFRALPGICFSTDDRDCLVIRMDEPALALVTNDCVRLHGEKEFEWRGRVDQVVNSGGIKLHPSELEAKVEGLIRSAHYFTGIDDKRLGQALILVIEGSAAESDSTLLEKLSERLGKYELPKAIYYITQLKRTTTGKIIRQWPL
jgi:O-succinylbenzoic acid--CoA ligase